MFYPLLSDYTYPGGYAMATATAAQSSAREARTDVQLYKHDLDRLLMITEALWTFMKQEHGYQDEALIKLIQDIDKRKVAEEGVAATAPPIKCPSCGRLNQAKRSFCMYCGKPISGNPFAR